MTKLKKELLVNSMDVYKYMAIYGIDRYNVKEDLCILYLIEKILEQNCYYGILTECDFTVINNVISKIKNMNPRLKYCRLNISDYKNLGGKQNIKTHQIMVQTNIITPLRQRLQNCGSSLAASDMKALLDALQKLESNINECITTFIPEAPKDGKRYVRANGAWVPLETVTLSGAFDNSYNEDYDK